MADHQLNTMRQQFDTLKQQSAELAKRNEAMKTEVNTAVRERRECIADISDLGAQRAKLMQDLADSKAEYADVQTRRGASDLELQEAKKTVDDTRKAVGDVEASLRAQKNDRDKLTSELEILRAAHVSMTAKIDNLNAAAPAAAQAPTPRAAQAAPPAPTPRAHEFLDSTANPFYDKVRGYYKDKYNAL